MNKKLFSTFLLLSNEKGQVPDILSNVDKS